MKHIDTGGVLGALYSPKKTVFRVWAPGADALETLLYDHGGEQFAGDPAGEKPLSTVSLTPSGGGFWEGEIPGNLKNTYYVYAVTREGLTKQAVDPYARAVGVNGMRGMVIDLPATDPPGFRERKRPPLAAPTDAVIYELHVRDLSAHPQSGISRRGKFLGLTEGGAKNAEGLSTGLDHILELGVTHIHLLPSFDFKTVDEAAPEGQFNWGYDPQNYNAPEGSYSTDPFHGETRVREFKLMVQALHERGLRVVMDVVYNHTDDISNFEILAPGRYYRMKRTGGYSDGSGCGNETASEQPMMRKFILDSVCYWAKEYLVDGFRFDLMGLHDIETMNLIREGLDKIDPGIIIYGEGWAAGDSVLPEEQRALKANAPALHPRIACFSDDMRDGVKGSVFYASQGGFINSGAAESSHERAGDRDEDVKFGIAAAVEHPGVDVQKVRYSASFWAKEPSQAVNYVSAHDNLTLWDKLTAVSPGADEETLLRQNKLAAAIVLTSQGIPFFQAGEEMARTKGGDENSYRSPDSVNRLDWERKSRFTGLVDYYRGLIALRKRCACFRLRSAQEIRERLRFLSADPGTIAYTLDGTPEAGFVIIFNGLAEARRVDIPEGDWDVLVNGDHAGLRPLARLAGGAVSVPAVSALVLCNAHSLPL
ncbi:MAG: type I pullulanase [Treponema sp.]|jgi:pullulanase|nr:type I pullulanase [Treponema sp.]